MLFANAARVPNSSGNNATNMVSRFFHDTVYWFLHKMWKAHVYVTAQCLFFFPKWTIFGMMPVRLYYQKYLSSRHREYILRAAVLLVTGALTINPESIFSGNIAWFGLQQGCSAETEPFFDLLSLALPKWLSFGPFFKLQFNEVKLTNHFL